MHLATSTLRQNEWVISKLRGKKKSHHKFKILQYVKGEMVTYEVMVQALLTNISVL